MNSFKNESDELLTWVNQKIGNKKIKNWTNDWFDGKTLCLLINSIRPGCIPESEIRQDIREVRIQAACLRAERELGVPDLILPEELASGTCKEKVLMTYVAFLRDVDQKKHAQSIQENDTETLYEINIDKDKSSQVNIINYCKGIPFKPSQCLAFGSGLRWGQVGKPAEFIMQLNSSINLSDMLVSIDCRPYDKRITLFRPHLEIKPLHGNCYLVKYTPTRPGCYNVSILYGNEHVQNSPFEIIIKETVLSEDKIDRQMELGNELSALVSESLIEKEDINNNELDDILSSIESVKKSFSHPTSLSKSTDYTASHDSAFVDDDELVKSISSGDFPLLEILDSIDQADNFVEEDVLKKGVKVSNFKIHGTGLHTGEVGRISTFSVHTPTYLGKTGVTQGPLGVSITCPAVSIPIPFVRTKFFPNMLEHNVLYIPTEPGIYEIAVKWGDLTICGSPFRLTVHDTELSLPSTTLPEKRTIPSYRNSGKFDLFLYYSATTGNDTQHQRKAVLEQILSKQCIGQVVFPIAIDIELTVKERRALYHKAESTELPFVFAGDEYIGDYHNVMNLYQENKFQKFFQKILRKFTNEQLADKIPISDEEML